MLHYQEAHGLEPTGTLNFASIAGLGLWNNLIGDPNGNGHKALEASNGSPPPRGGKNQPQIGGAPLPSQRYTTGNGAGAGDANGASGSSNANNRAAR